MKTELVKKKIKAVKENKEVAKKLLAKKNKKEKLFLKDSDCRPFRAFIKGLLKLLINLLFPLKYLDSHHIPKEGPFILIGNHLSIFDVIAVHVHLKQWVFWVAKKELFDVPVLGAIVRRLGAIPIDRKRVDLTAVKSIFQVLKAKMPVGIFPHGTRIKEKNWLAAPVELGTVSLVMKTKMPIVPFKVTGPFRLFKRPYISFGAPFMLYTWHKGHLDQQAKAELAHELMLNCYQLAPEVKD